jgi:SAM-dependent methyltransferase
MGVPLDDKRRREIFNEDPELYDRARPGYPPEVFADLQSLAELGPGSRMLEIGCGTGQATRPLAALGCDVVALDIGADTAAVARRRLADLPNVEVITTSFEDWPLLREPFDAVVSATAWHWVEPEVRLAKSARALRPGGWLAVISTHHVAGGTEDFFVEVQQCYERWDPETEPGFRLPAADTVEPGASDLDAGGGFGAAQIRRYEWDRPYRTQEYIDLLLTFSGHRAMEPSARAGLLDCVGQMIETRYGGGIVRRYLTQLSVAQLLARST